MTGDWSEPLRAAGFHDDEIGRRATLFDRVLARWGEGFGDGRPTLAFHVPGRIEVLGKHTDYAGGRSLVCATEQGLAVLAAPRSDRMVRVLDALRREARTFQAVAGIEPTRGDWANYPMTVARRFALDHGDLIGVDLAFASDLPFAAGVSSSSAIVVAVALVLIEINELHRRPSFTAAAQSTETLGAYLGAVENGRPFGTLAGSGGVGTLGGNQDQVAILSARPNALAQYRFDQLALEQLVRWPEELIFAIAASGVVAEKTGAALERYNDLARLTAQLAELAEDRRSRALGTLLMADPGAASALAGRLAAWPDRTERARLLARLTQLDGECRSIIPGVAHALRHGDLGRLGELVAASQQAAVSGLENQVPETVALVDLARCHGAVAASAFGAGFGGSVWAMVERARAASFVAEWDQAYKKAFPTHVNAAAVFLTRPAPPASRLAVPDLA